MCEKLPIYVTIPTLNAGGHLEELLDSIQPYVEDIVICDSLSIDNTVDIALRRGVKIVQRPFVTSSDQFGWMSDNLWKIVDPKLEWGFGMAQDERFTPELIEAIRQQFEKGIPDDVDGFTINWRLWFMGKQLHATSRVLRFMRRGKCKVTQVACNEHNTVPGKVLHLNAILEHKDTLNLHEWYEKQNLWTTREAIQRVNPPSNDEFPKLFGTRQQRKAFIKQLLNHMPLGKIVIFWYYFLIFGAWKDGRVGWTWASLRVWVHQVIVLKEREMREHGVPQIIPEGRHGVFDSRVLKSGLQYQLLPETISNEI